MNGANGQPVTATDGAFPAERGVRSAWASARSVWHWFLCAAYFFPVCAFLVFLGVFIDPRKNDGAQRMLCRVTAKLAGVKLRVRHAAGYDPGRTCFLVSNHVNLFDPFVLYASIPQFFRGLELESHFHIPVYGWMMKRFGNVPVPNDHSPTELKRMWRMTRAALDSGVSLVAFPEGARTLDGRVRPFKDGVFRMAVQFGTPIVPVSMVGAFEFNRKTSWMLRPGQVDVYLHDMIETKGLRKEDVAELRERVQRIVSAPIEANYAAPRVTTQPQVAIAKN